ncbi:MAG: hypothetical protein C0514_07520 [Candidatus Puniceispirillum sp.]|nr:hypothetical protein [Candidatus Puniceispirillum sp.]
MRFFAPLTLTSAGSSYREKNREVAVKKINLFLVLCAVVWIAPVYGSAASRASHVCPGEDAQVLGDWKTARSKKPRQVSQKKTKPPAGSVPRQRISPQDAYTLVKSYLAQGTQPGGGTRPLIQAVSLAYAHATLLEESVFNPLYARACAALGTKLPRDEQVTIGGKKYGAALCFQEAYTYASHTKDASLVADVLLRIATCRGPESCTLGDEVMPKLTLATRAFDLLSADDKALRARACLAILENWEGEMCTFGGKARTQTQALRAAYNAAVRLEGGELAAKCYWAIAIRSPETAVMDLHFEKSDLFRRCAHYTRFPHVKADALLRAIDLDLKGHPGVSKRVACRQELQEVREIGVSQRNETLITRADALFEKLSDLARNAPPPTFRGASWHSTAID